MRIYDEKITIWLRLGLHENTAAVVTTEVKDYGENGNALSDGNV
jgi:hypothetical protein